jgi:hypothetical protein
MASLGGHVRGQCMSEPGRVELLEGRCGGGADEAVQQYRDVLVPCGERCTHDRGEFAASQRGRDLQRIAESGFVHG